MAKKKQKSGQSLPVLSEVNSDPENGNSTLKDLNNMGGVMLEGGARAITQNINVGGLSGNQVYVAVDGINNQLADFSHGHNSARQLPNPFLFKQVSASAGGSNILYGSGNVGGAINFTTVDPMNFIKDGKWYGGSVTAGAETGAPGGNIGGAVAIKTGPVSFLFDVIGQKNANVRLGEGGVLDNSSAQNLQYLAKSVWDIDTHQQVKVSYLSMHNSGNYPVNNKVESAGNPATEFDYLQQQSNLIYTYNPNNPYVDFKIQGFYNRNNIQSNSVPSSTPLDTIYSQKILLTQTGVNTQNASTIYEQHLLYGTDYQYIEGEDLADRGGVNSLPNSTQQLYSLFLQDSRDIIDSLNITIGGRANGYYGESNGLKNKGVLFTKQATLTYDIVKKWSVHAGYNEGFRIPGIQELYLEGFHPGSTSEFIIPNPTLKPEISQIKTIGTTFTQDITKEQSFTLGGNIFLNNVKDYITATYIDNPDPSGPPVQLQEVNISKAVLYGYVVNAQYSTPWFSLMSNFTYTRGKTQSDYVNEEGEVIPSGNPLPIPRAKGLVSLAVPLQRIESDVTINVNYAVAQKHILTGTAASNVPGYMLLGLAYSWHPKGLLDGINITAGVDNALNHNYVNYDPSNIYITSAMGRNIYVQATYSF